MSTNKESFDANEFSQGWNQASLDFNSELILEG